MSPAMLFIVTQSENNPNVHHQIKELKEWEREVGGRGIPLQWVVTVSCKDTVCSYMRYCMPTRSSTEVYSITETRHKRSCV